MDRLLGSAECSPPAATLSPTLGGGRWQGWEEGGSYGYDLGAAVSGNGRWHGLRKTATVDKTASGNGVNDQ